MSEYVGRLTVRGQKEGGECGGRLYTGQSESGSARDCGRFGILYSKEKFGHQSSCVRFMQYNQHE